MGTDTTPGGYVQLGEVDLSSIQLQHLTSAIDMSISLPEGLAASTGVITGYTEWIGRWKDRSLSIGWDWAFADEVLSLIHVNEIRSNLQLVCEKGVPLSAAQCRLRLASWLETLPWRDGAVRELVHRNRRPCRR
jgi:hypothetical protein